MCVRSRVCSGARVSTLKSKFTSSSDNLIRLQTNCVGWTSIMWIACTQNTSARIHTPWRSVNSIFSMFYAQHNGYWLEIMSYANNIAANTATRNEQHTYAQSIGSREKKKVGCRFDYVLTGNKGYGIIFRWGRLRAHATKIDIDLHLCGVIAVANSTNSTLNNL